MNFQAYTKCCDVIIFIKKLSVLSSVDSVFDYTVMYLWIKELNFGFVWCLGVTTINYWNTRCNEC